MEETLETGMVGCHGAVGTCLAFGEDVPIHHSIVLFRGQGLRIRATDLRNLTDRISRLRHSLQRCCVGMTACAAQVALCCLRHRLEERLACWLCLACDALGRNTLPITHDQLAIILGIRRSSVTETLIHFEERKLLCKMRGVVQITDRRQLENTACDCYRIMSARYLSTRSQLARFS